MSDAGKLITRRQLFANLADEHDCDIPFALLPRRFVVASDLLTRRHVERIVKGDGGQAAVLRDAKAEQH